MSQRLGSDKLARSCVRPRQLNRWATRVSLELIMPKATKVLGVAALVLIERIIAGPNVFICADCVAVCEHIVKKRWPDYEPPPFDDSKYLDR